MRLITKGKKRHTIDPCFLYVFGLRDASGPVPYSKIGIAQNISHRLSDLAAVQPFEAFCEMQHPYANRLVAQASKKDVCKALADTRSHGDWFKGYPADVAEKVRSLCFKVEPEVARYFRSQNGFLDAMEVAKTGVIK